MLNDDAWDIPAFLDAKANAVERASSEARSPRLRPLVFAASTASDRPPMSVRLDTPYLNDHDREVILALEAADARRNERKKAEGLADLAEHKARKAAEQAELAAVQSAVKVAVQADPLRRKTRPPASGRGKKATAKSRRRGHL